MSVSIEHEPSCPLPFIVVVRYGANLLNFQCRTLDEAVARKREVMKALCGDGGTKA